MGDERWAEILGYTLDEIKTDPMLWQNQVHPDDLKKGIELWEKFLNGEIEKYEYDKYRVQHRSGKWLWVTASGIAVERNLENKAEAIPMEDGFLNKWLAKIPVGDKLIECIGVCFVQFDEQGKIRRNEVYFDRTELVSEIYKLKKYL